MSGAWQKARRRGILMAVSGGIFWGGSGVAGQYLLQDAGFDTAWLVVARMLLAGVILLAYDAFQHQGDIFSLWKHADTAKTLLIFSLLGMMLVQYSYFACIRYGNAAAATVMQYLMPAFIVLYTTLRYRRLPTRQELLCVLLAIIGTMLLATRGDFHALALPPLAIFWGVVSGITGAVYTVVPKNLIRATRASLVVGWGMLFGGTALALLTRPGIFSGAGTFTPLSASVFAYLIVFGSVLAFTLYLGSTKYIRPGETGVLASVEPVTAIVLSVLLLGTPIGFAELLGSFCILLTLFLTAKAE